MHTATSPTLQAKPQSGSVKQPLLIPPCDTGAHLAFEALKLSFLHVLEGLPAQAQLQGRVASAQTPQALWHLRAHVFSVLSGTECGQIGRRQLLNRSLESMQGFLEEPAHSSLRQ